MKKILALMLLAVFTVTPAVAQQGDMHDGMKQGGMMGKGSGMGMMNDEHMQERMQRMHEQVNQARQTGDPEKRREFMREHMKTMHGTMQEMRGGMGRNSEGTAKPSEMPMEKRMQRMEQHMQMMQGMMQQMMERESLEEE
ncbi:hypothetical protein [Salicola sp. Rm-C-2C1-2]|uniref:hypothetical protein n=1 Tax=Salicola sp. Rm-C-2C1-2 TaxID=3141321 RepID=UPI0032E47711